MISNATAKSRGATLDPQAVIVAVEEAIRRTFESDHFCTQLNAILDVLRGARPERAAEEHGVSLRSLQRWLRKLREEGPPAFEAAERRGRKLRLSAPQLTRLRNELKRPPHSFGLAGEQWSGATLSRYLSQRYGISIGERRCRTLLQQLGSAKPSAITQSSPASNSQRSTRKLKESVETVPNRFTLSDWERKRRALRKIQRLASSGLPLTPFIHTLFDISAEAIDQTDISCIGQIFGSFVPRHLDLNKWGHIYKETVMDLAGVSGVISVEALEHQPKTVLQKEELVLNNYRQSTAYNEFFKPLDIEQEVMTILKDQDELVGFYPVFRNSRMKSWSSADVNFLQAAMPHIAHGVASVSQLGMSTDLANDLHPIEFTSQAVILANLNGQVIALNQSAQALFKQVGLLDRVPINAFANDQLKFWLGYIARILRSIFFDRGEPSFDLHSPVIRFYAHRAGLILKLRGFLTSGVGDPEHRYLTVLVEPHETAAHRQQRLMYRLGLSPKETELVLRLASTPQSAALAASMNVSRETLKTYFKRLAEKLELRSRAELSRFALEQVRMPDHQV